MIEEGVHNHCIPVIGDVIWWKEIQRKERGYNGYRYLR